VYLFVFLVVEFGEVSLQGLEYNDVMCMTPWGCLPASWLRNVMTFLNTTLKENVCIIQCNLVCCAWKYWPLYAEIILTKLQEVPVSIKLYYISPFGLFHSAICYSWLQRPMALVVKIQMVWFVKITYSHGSHLFYTRKFKVQAFLYVCVVFGDWH
jgi:hypothetical protein